MVCHDYPVTFWLTESNLLRPGRPFYLPDWDDRFSLRPMLALRIGRVGKGISARFAYRYITQMSLWLIAVGETSRAALSARGLPWSSAIDFDNSAISAPFIDCDYNELSANRYQIEIDGQKSLLTLHKENDPALMLEKISERNIMRTGDILLINFEDAPLYPRAEQHIRQLINDQEMNSFKIK